MNSSDLADGARQLREIEATVGDEATREVLRVLGNAISVGNISDSTGIAIGQNIRQVISRFELSPDAAAALLDLRAGLGHHLGLAVSLYDWGILLADRTRD